MTIKTRRNYKMLMGTNNQEVLVVRVLRRAKGLPGWFHVVDQDGDRFVTHESHLFA